MGANRIIKFLMVLVVAFLAQWWFSQFPGPLWFIAVFLLVGIAVRFLVSPKDGLMPSYLEDVVLSLVVCALLGALAWYLDTQISGYTGKAGGPAVPALVLGFTDIVIRR